MISPMPTKLTVPNFPPLDIPIVDNVHFCRSKVRNGLGSRNFAESTNRKPFQRLEASLPRRSGYEATF